MRTKSKKIITAAHLGGRPRKIDKDQWGQITCVLRHDTIERLREGADSKHFGEFLQDHLDRYPPPNREQYLSLTEHKDYYTVVKRKKVPTIYAAPAVPRPKPSPEERELARKERERKAFDKATEILMSFNPKLDLKKAKWHGENRTGKVA